MGKILNFTPKEEDDGYDYFAKALIDSICEGIPNSEDFEIVIMDEDDNPCEIESMATNVQDRKIYIYLKGEW